VLAQTSARAAPALPTKVFARPGGRVRPILLKTAWEVLMTPVTYKVVGFQKRKENEDYFDRALTSIHSG
jgi:hypothetical protein